MKLLLVDLDGTVRQPKSGAKFISKPDDQELIPGVKEAIAHYSSDWTIAGITNQGGVAAGHKSLEDAITEQKITIDLTSKVINEIYLCPDFEGLRCIHCSYRGDREEDQLAAQAAGVQFMWADQWRSSSVIFCKG